MLTLRVGLPSTTGSLPRVAADAGLPALVSAGGLWQGTRFRQPGAALDGLDVALDSAGFVATVLHGGYRWTSAQYAGLAASRPWAWWAAMDLCCEPQIAADRATVEARVAGTAALLSECVALAPGVEAPLLPVLQGWRPDDYAESSRLTDRCLGGAWPELIGVGSVCRRPWTGPDGLAAVVGRLDRELPPTVRLHLFGVKGAALARLDGHPRIASADSMAWDYAARREARSERRSCSIALRAAHMLRWAQRQAPGPQQSLPLGLGRRLG